MTCGEQDGENVQYRKPSSLYALEQIWFRWGFTANDASFNKRKVGYVIVHIAVSFRLIVYAITYMTITNSTVLLYEFASKQTNKEHKLVVKKFL